MTGGPSNGELILYRTGDGRAAIRLRAIGGTVGQTQAEIAALFDTSLQNASLHLKNIFENNELDRASVLKEFLITAADGKAYTTRSYQNKLVHAVTRRTAAERIVERADPAKPNMALTSWTGAPVRKAEVTVSKNYSMRRRSSPSTGSPRGFSILPKTAPRAGRKPAWLTGSRRSTAIEQQGST